MADINSRLPENVPGKFSVTSECIDCGMCQEIAPTIFKCHDHTGYSTVFHQPETPAEHEAAEEALTSCPVDAIGNNGG